MAIISKKKIIYPVQKGLRDYLLRYGRAINLPITYEDLLRYDNSVPLYDSKEKDTLWETVFYPQSDMQDIFRALQKIYALMKSDGDLSVIDHLFIDRVDLCTYGNTQPFRVRIVNRINDNFDYFYIKKADASRIYGLDLEHLLSPNEIVFLVDNSTLIEEHIVGIPGDQFIRTRMSDPNLNKIRFAKEFVKFNERCFVRLLGDMHSSNFVVDITPDFEEVHYRFRAIDFDQQSFEGRAAIYMPKYFKQNNPIIKLGMEAMTPETMKQYQREERTMILHRVQIQKERITNLLGVMKNDKVSTDQNVERLKKDLTNLYEEPNFMKCDNMGELLGLSLEMLQKKPDLYHE